MRAHARSPTGNSATRDHKRRSIFTSSSTTADAVQVAIKPEKDPPKFSCTLCPATSTTRGPFTITDNLRVLIALILGECPAGLASEEAKVCQACRGYAMDHRSVRPVLVFVGGSEDELVIRHQPDLVWHTHAFRE